jgi:hypothetical protein
MIARSFDIDAIASGGGCGLVTFGIGRTWADTVIADATKTRIKRDFLGITSLLLRFNCLRIYDL